MPSHPGPGSPVKETSEGAVYRLPARSAAGWKLLGLLLIPGGLLLLWVGNALVSFALTDPGVRRDGGWLLYFMILGPTFAAFAIGVQGILYGLWLVTGVDEIVLGPSRIGMRRRVGPVYFTKWRRRERVRRIALVEDETHSHLVCRLRIEAEGSRPVESCSRHPREFLRPLARRLADRCLEKSPEFDGFFNAPPKVSVAEESADPMDVRDRVEPPVGCPAILARGPHGLTIELPAPGFRDRETILNLVLLAFMFGFVGVVTIGMGSGAIDVGATDGLVSCSRS